MFGVEAAGKAAAAGAAALALALAAAAPALGHEADSGSTEHAVAHDLATEAAERADRAWLRLSPAEQEAALRSERVRSRRFARGTSGAAAQKGKWTTAPFELPIVAIHSILLPSGKILFWGPPEEQLPNETDAYIWNPRRGTGPDSLEQVTPPTIDKDGPGGSLTGPAPLYCSGQSLLPNGDVLVTGGNLVWPDTYEGANEDGYTSYAGLDTVFIFDVSEGEWIQQEDMAAGRWYPTQTLLPDGRTLILGGYTEDAPGEQNNTLWEVFVPPGPGETQGDIVSLGNDPGGPDRWRDLYPHLFTAPNGGVLMGGPHAANSGLFDVSDAPPVTAEGFDNLSRDRYGSTAVLGAGGPRGSGKITVIGGAGPEIVSPATETAETITPLIFSGGEWVLRSGPFLWDSAASLQEPRFYPNTVQLPDSTMVTVGGGSGRTEERGNHTTDGLEARRVELFDPATGSWRLGPAQLEDRTYHSTAILLPDGRVWSAGDDNNPFPDDPESVDTAEIYSPPYLFKGERPVIRSAPGTAGWNKRIKIRTRSRGRPAITKAVLVAPSAPTHAVDMGQRVVPLRVKERFGRRGLDAMSPPDANVAPPGHYMLFGLTAKGVPSVAKWVRLTAP
jgi:hypothetical protein